MFVEEQSTRKNAHSHFSSELWIPYPRFTGIQTLTILYSIFSIRQSGVVELFDMDLKKLTSTIEVPDDGITCLSTIPGQPHIMLGENNCKVIITVS